MTNNLDTAHSIEIHTIDDVAQTVNYSLMDTLNRDPDATEDGEDFHPRQVFRGHYVPVKPTPIAAPVLVAYSAGLFRELGFDANLATTDDFTRLFSGDLSNMPTPIRPYGWATGYALSIYGTEYKQQCPFQTGNGYGDGRAISVLELVANGQRWEMQLKGAGPTPYCRGADGRAVLRSSVREFLAQEYMHALGVPTTRSLCLFASQSERVDRPWYSANSNSENPDIMLSNPVAITTRVAPSFLRVGQIELFGRRTRYSANKDALPELEMIVSHLITREYADVIDSELPLHEQVVLLAEHYCERLCALVADWLRVGYCQGNFNSDNCAAGGFTLDYGPFGFCGRFDPFYQPWTGGGRHFSFLNQPFAAQQNFNSFCTALAPLLVSHDEADARLDDINDSFAERMESHMNAMWSSKLGLKNASSEFVLQLLRLMAQGEADFTLLFRELSHLPDDFSALQRCFYSPLKGDVLVAWQAWFTEWRSAIHKQGDAHTVSAKMKRVNPKYGWREWLVVPAYERAMQGDFTLVQELQRVLTAPYDEQSEDIEAKYYGLTPSEFRYAGGVSHYSCSS